MDNAGDQCAYAVERGQPVAAREWSEAVDAIAKAVARVMACV